MGNVLRVESQAKPLPPRQTDPVMENALSDFFGAALRRLKQAHAAATTIEGKDLHIPTFEITDEPNRYGINTQTKIEMVTDWTWFVLRRYDQLRELPELKEGLAALSKHVEVEKFYGCDQSYFFHPVIELIETSKGLDVPQEMQAAAAKSLAEHIVDGRYQVETECVLKGFHSAVSPIRFDSFEIRNHTVGECRAIWEGDGKAAADGNSLNPGDFVAKVYGVADSKEHGKEYWEYLRQLQKVVFCLRLLKSGRIQIDNRPSMGKLGWAYGMPGTQRLVSPWHKGKTYRLSAEDVAAFHELWARHSKIFDSDDRRLSLAIKRFNGYYDRETPEDGIIDTFIGFEALLTENNHEITYRLSLRAANLIGETPQEREAIFNDVKAGYKLRSLIVHGEELKKQLDLPSAQGKVNLKDFGEAMSRYLARAILRVSGLGLAKPETELLPHLDKLALK
ncbi:MAG TPA: hypothetical protein DCZ01_02300 [Elusimicrobia bacterium]|nr:MAG: hypothetical protein A2X37_10100 [Elusimicrobia bacterium GWA2_66_18]HAZ07359.1 hypothetical protein [Elusimicrobiota bacterium]